MNNIVEEKSFEFAKRIVNLKKYLVSKFNEYTLSDQVLRSGTSVGANIVEAQNARTNAEFISKISIAQGECSETKYWINLLYETNYISEKEYFSLYSECDEIYKILSSILLTSKNKCCPQDH
ncbi:MAG: four helix bundle protein [Ruminococcaceae bacterium]|nr:four helix bundle protein [Oscillospiraceae bacterium]